MKANQGDGDRHNGNDRRAPALQEDEHDDHDERRRLEQGLVDLVHALGDEFRGVVDDLMCNTRREIAFEFLHSPDDLIRCGKRIGAGALEDPKGNGRVAVEVRIRHVILCTEFDARHVLQPHEASLRRSLDDDLPELTRVLEPPLRRYSQLERGIRRCRLLPQGTARDLDILLLDRTHHLTRRHAVGGELLRIEPDPQGILPLAEDDDVANSIQPQQDVAHIVTGVVGDIELIVGSIRREHVHDHH
jgi:hypothetical protein